MLYVFYVGLTMTRKELQQTISNLTTEIESVADDRVRSIQKTLLNLLEYVISENDKLKEENQKLRDENHRLKGEKGKPSIRKQSNGNSKHSSESERKPRGKNKKKKSKKKKDKIKIDRTEVCEADLSTLPSDVEFKGYQSVVVQDITIQTDNIEFKKQIYYSPSLKKTYIAPLPDGYQGEFGPHVKAFILDLHHNGKMTESAIHTILTNHGIKISTATVSRVLTERLEVFHKEKKDIVSAGLSSSKYQQMDDTGARVKGKNYYTHILCNHLYTAFFTRPRKDRLTILDILTQGEIGFCFNESAYDLMVHMKLPEKSLRLLKYRVRQEMMTRSEVDKILKELFPNQKKHTTNRRVILEASAIVAYQKSEHAVEILLTDDAPQFKQITDLLALCWVHDGRHYKKLRPIISKHRDILEAFLSQYWDYYHKLLDYKKHPTSELCKSLGDEFDVLFSTITGYEQLDERIMKTKLKKESLLLVLKHPVLPLHNNSSELGARIQARYRDISFHTINEKGTEAKDTFMTIGSTAKKLMVNSYQYILDRVSKKFEMPSLASLIENSSPSPG